MWLAILANWRIILWGAVALLVSASLLLVNHWRNQANLYEAAKQEVADTITKCNANQKLTEKANADLQQSRNVVASKLNHALSLQAVCIGQASESNVVGTGAKHAGQDAFGLSSGWLEQYGAQCETYRSERIALEQFIDAK